MGENTKIEWATHSFNPWVVTEPYATGMIRVGKKRAGRLLDGVQHDGFPR